MSTFKGRPVFDMQPNWDVEPKVNFLSESDWNRLGFGVTSSWMVDSQSDRHLEFEVLAMDNTEAAWLRAFFDQSRGRMVAFWVPTWINDLSLYQDVQNGGSSLTVEDIGFRDLWDQPPYQAFIALVDVNGIECLEVTSVSASASNTETISLKTPVSRSFSRGNTKLCFLIYARFVEDELAFEYETDRICRSRIRVMELHEEYAQAELGARPVWLYKLTYDNTIHRWTSHGSDLLIDGDTWVATDINHSEVTQSLEFLDEPVQVFAQLRDETEVLSRYLSGVPARNTTFALYKSFAPEFSQLKEVYQGELAGVVLKAAGRVELKLSSILRIAERSAPRFYMQTRCNFKLFDPYTCKLDSQNWKTVGIITSLKPTFLRAAAFGDKAITTGHPQYFAGGTVVVGNELRHITKQSGDQLYLNAPFYEASVHDEVTAFPGCDKQFKTCSEQFRNEQRFGGFHQTPPINPSLDRKAVPKQESSGGRRGK